MSITDRVKEYWEKLPISDNNFVIYDNGQIKPYVDMEEQEMLQYGTFESYSEYAFKRI